VSFELVKHAQRRIAIFDIVEGTTFFLHVSNILIERFGVDT